MTAHLVDTINLRDAIAPDDVLGQYLDIIKRAIIEHPRSQQSAIGPSEVGDPCSRRLGYKLLGHPEREQAPNWRATVGTGIHMWLETAFDADNLRVATDGQERWFVETKLTCGDVNGKPLTGSCDLYDRWTGTVIDHKTCSPSVLKKYRANGPSEIYRAQAHLYGRGWQLAGEDVRTVAICFLPRNGDLAEAYQWSEPYDEQVALDALQRVAGIELATSLMGDAALATLPTADSYCHTCPFHRSGSTDLAAGCPGDPGAQATAAASTTTQLDGLI